MCWHTAAWTRPLYSDVFWIVSVHLKEKRLHLVTCCSRSNCYKHVIISVTSEIIKSSHNKTVYEAPKGRRLTVSLLVDLLVGQNCEGEDARKGTKDVQTETWQREDRPCPRSGCGQSLVCITATCSHTCRSCVCLRRAHLTRKNKCPSVSSVPVSSVCPRPHDVITLPLPRFWFPAHSSSAFVDVISLCQLLMTHFAVY